MQQRTFRFFKIMVMAFTIVSASLLGGMNGPVYAESVDDLKAQLKTMQEKMMEMQKSMQAMQGRLGQLETAPAPAVAQAAEGAAPASGTAAPSVWSKYNMRLYGKVKVDAHYDTAELNNNDWVRAVVQGDDYKNDSVNFNPRDTRFGFEAGHKWDNWLAKGRVEIDFYGDNAGNSLLPRMRLGYVDLSHDRGTSVRIGQDWTPVAQLNPSTIDFGVLSSAGNLWWRVPQATVRQKLGNFEILASAMKHRTTDNEREDRMPWILSRVAYSNGFLGEKGMLALGAGYRHADYGDDNSEDTDRWLVCGEFRYKYNALTLKGEIWTGAGIGENFLRYDLDMSEELDPDQLSEPAAAFGGWIDLTYAFTDKFSMTAGYGVDNPDDDDIGNTFTDLRFTRNEQYYLNAWYQLAKPIKVGMEWIHVETERDNDDNYGNRFTTSICYVF